MAEGSCAKGLALWEGAVSVGAVVETGPDPGKFVEGKSSIRWGWCSTRIDMGVGMKPAKVEGGRQSNEGVYQEGLVELVVSQGIAKFDMWADAWCCVREGVPQG